MHVPCVDMPGEHWVKCSFGHVHGVDLDYFHGKNPCVCIRRSDGDEINVYHTDPTQKNECVHSCAHPHVVMVLLVLVCVVFESNLQHGG